MNNLLKYTVLCFALIYSSLCFGGGPLILQGPTGNTPVTYQNPNITVHVENGDLSATVTNADANIIVQQAFDLWNNVTTSSINLSTNTTLINADINISNFDSYIPSVDGSVFNAGDNLNPIVYDSNGEIIDAFFGVGQSDFTIGFAASIFTIGASHFDEGYAVINGKEFDPPLSNTTFKLLIAHEIGHFFGLDHTQVNIDNETEFDFPTFCSRANEDYPLMYPFICRDIETLHSDDISAVSALYPATNINNNFGILQGRFVDRSGISILGANIWAENTITGASYSIVSDYLKQRSGFYKLFLPAGTYTLHANSINPEFTGGSGVGPYSSTALDASFICPHPITPVSYQVDGNGNDEVITISVNQTTEINFSSIEVNIFACTTSSGSGAISHITLLFLLGFLILSRHSVGRGMAHKVSQ